METWGWLIAYVVGFGLLQLLLYRYFQRDDPSPDVTPGPGDQSARRSLEQSREPSSDDGRYCYHCGTLNGNEQPFAYCKECVRPLQ